MKEKGEVIAGGKSGKPLRKAGELEKKYCGNPGDHVKKTSTSHTSQDGTKFETH